MDCIPASGGIAGCHCHPGQEEGQWKKHWFRDRYGSCHARGGYRCQSGRRDGTAAGAALARVEGVGEVQVVLSLESTNQKVVEKDIPSSKSSQSSSGSDGSSSSSAASTEESTVYQKGSDGSETPM
ncbi:hypothetical protein DXA96_10310 [Lachnospiraceae bacterium OF09-33XD]|nr:hypothetical protein DXA96_10310 [Lachnospiraceae bacterium OF09-33XD]